MFVVNVCGKDVKEVMYGYGEMSIKADEVKDIPEGVAKCWMDKNRCGEVLVQPVKPGDAETAKAMEMPLEAPVEEVFAEVVAEPVAPVARKIGGKK